MLRGITRAGLGEIGSDERMIDMAAAYGFEAVDVDAKGLVERSGVERTKERLLHNRLIVGSIGLNVEWRQDDTAFRDGLPDLIAAAQAASSLGCQSCCTYILPSTDQLPAVFMAQAVKRLRTAANILDAYGIKLGLEFVGPHHLRTRWQYPFIWSMDHTLAFIDAIGASNTGLLLDAYHWHTTGGTIADIKALRPDQIVHVHINDAADLPVEQVLDNDRLFPGEGVIDLAGFLGSLKDIGYRGVVSQEILTPAAPSGTVEALFERSKAGFDNVFAAAGITSSVLD